MTVIRARQNADGPAFAPCGYELAKEELGDTAQLAAIVRSSDVAIYSEDLEEKINSWIQSGFQMHLAKPVDPAELIVAVASLAKRTSQGPE